MAVQVRVLAGWSGSVAGTGRLMVSASALVWLPGLVMVGAVLVSLTVTVMASLLVRLGDPSSVTVMSKV